MKIAILTAGKFFSVSMLVVYLVAGVFDSANSQTKTNNPIVVFTTSMGDISIELYSDKAPISAKNFLSYVNSGFYNGVIFHRVIPRFMIQGGGFTKDMTQKKTQPPIQNEAKNGLKNERGTLSMARTQDVNSATSQFFINLVDNRSLDPGANGFGYAVFGKVTAGMDVVDKIATVKTTTVGMFQNVPAEAITIISAKAK
jgi:peptidyl-prolyl cis-trans isomerase A (cyclophilin A)